MPPTTRKTKMTEANESDEEEKMPKTLIESHNNDENKIEPESDVS